jgi:hypothetical protein
MEISSLTKYISLNKLINGTVEVLFSGHPCLTIRTFGQTNESIWIVNPVFAKLVYGANVFEDIPFCNDEFDSVEEAIADGLVKLHDLGAFNTEYDFPEDTYAATLTSISEDVFEYLMKNKCSIIDAIPNQKRILSEIYSCADMTKYIVETKSTEISDTTIHKNEELPKIKENTTKTNIFATFLNATKQKEHVVIEENIEVNIPSEEQIAEPPTNVVRNNFEYQTKYGK